MDENNLRNRRGLSAMKRVRSRLLEHAGRSGDIADPGTQGILMTYNDVMDGCKGLPRNLDNIGRRV